MFLASVTACTLFLFNVVVVMDLCRRHLCCSLARRRARKRKEGRGEDGRREWALKRSGGTGSMSVCPSLSPLWCSQCTANRGRGHGKRAALSIGPSPTGVAALL
ncbi:hypothetical protein AAFF_G00167330 [Aldrovandia affinis]|uniref:Secreted protein n=1 Tax=Aldrovandia affinis TaxID=143900 RepID=A0AAD7RM96_9TELE|nr:hypothetical protein AAFF_G00167330 [Aldrovandia affinis]